jgi:hypothetical protein
VQLNFNLAVFFFGGKFISSGKSRLGIERIVLLVAELLEFLLKPLFSYHLYNWPNVGLKNEKKINNKNNGKRNLNKIINSLNLSTLEPQLNTLFTQYL